MHTYTNQLIHETSPYLLQHAHNPVNWYAWSEEAFAKAQREDKPVLVSIGYAACHWCHVMERESFEDPATAAIMNEHFINIKVDREERPDVDHIYMDAVQAMTGSGGWPLNVFLTPDGKPFYGGTYFPPRRAFNRASWTETLQAVAQTYQQKKEDIYQQAENLTEHLKASNAFGINTSTAADTVFQPAKMEEAFQNIMQSADKEWGGFGSAPKFPQTFTITFLLRYYHITGNQQALDQALLSLDKMIQGGIYDHIGGGFARYSTDAEWLAPHFEKMLYDNALLVSTLAEAYQLTQRDIYRQVIAETVQFIEREMLHPGGGFYSALDADSEGVEGKYYVWSFEEVQQLLGNNADIFCRYFDITPTGNWEHTNILWVKKPIPGFAEENHMAVETLQHIIATGKEKLLQKRNERIRPALDDKVLLSWNALMNIAYSKAYMATGEEQYKDMAVRNMQFLLQAFHKKDNIYYHTWKNDQVKHPAFLDDYSNLIYALIYIAQITADYSYLQKAKDIVGEVVSSFKDDESPLFFYTHAGQKDILLRKKEVYDGATPSGNAVMATNLYMLSILLDEKNFRQQAEEMLISLGDIAAKYPTSFGVWLTLLQQVIYGTSEIAIIGQDWQNKLHEVFKLYMPHLLVMAAPAAFDEYPLLQGKVVPKEETKLFLCKDYSCRQPVHTVQELAQLLNANNFKIIQ